MSKILKFIEDNNIKLEGSGSGTNGDLCILSGYALFLDLELEELEEVLISAKLDYNDKLLTTVFEFAECNNYGAWWNTKAAKDQYTF